MKNPKIIVPGAAGQVGQNLIKVLKDHGYDNIVAIDKHKYNLNILRKLNPTTTIIEADLSVEGPWQKEFENADVVIMLQAQIGSLNYDDFIKNTINSTKLILSTVSKSSNLQLIHISSAVLNSNIDNFYNASKREQEQLILNHNPNCLILRPTLMFGWFDRKHVGWISNFLRVSPIFPIPGHGDYIRRPLYVKDFCNIILRCINNKQYKGIYNIYGMSSITYYQLIKKIKLAISSNALIIKIPYRLFYLILWLWGILRREPAFTTQQLEYLVADFNYEVIDWENIFDLKSTSMDSAFSETYNDNYFSSISLKF